MTASILILTGFFLFLFLFLFPFFFLPPFLFTVYGIPSDLPYQISFFSFLVDVSLFIFFFFIITLLEYATFSFSLLLLYGGCFSFIFGFLRPFFSSFFFFLFILGLVLRSKGRKEGRKGGRRKGGKEEREEGRKEGRKGVGTHIFLFFCTLFPFFHFSFSSLFLSLTFLSPFATCGGKDITNIIYFFGHTCTGCRTGTLCVWGKDKGD